jgi:uncharacterized protein YegL
MLQKNIQLLEKLLKEINQKYWVSASISTGSQKVDNGQKEVIGLNDLPPPPPEVNIVL